MRAVVKNAVESALVAFAVGATCLWFLISEASADEPKIPMIILLSLGLGAGVLVHVAWMILAAMRDGRRAWAWAVALVLAFPLGTVVLLVLLFTRPMGEDTNLGQGGGHGPGPGKGATIEPSPFK